MSAAPERANDPREAAGRPYRLGALRGRAFAALAPELERALPGWLAGQEGPGSERMSAAAFRSGPWTVKRFPAPSVFGWLRAPRAVRSARRHFACLPVPSPRPLVAVARSRRGPSLLVREFVAGRVLTELWGRDEASEAALPGFLAELRRLPMQHGDLHPGNLLWTGARWVLLDVDGLRHGLHLRARVLFGQWVCLASRLADEERVERLFQRTQELARGLDPTRWEDLRRALARRGPPGAKGAGTPLRMD